MPFVNVLIIAAMAATSLFQEYPGFQWNKKSTLTAEEQVEFPGIVLDPGTYIVRLKESGEKRSVVEVMNQDESQVLVTILAVPDFQQRNLDSAEFLFHETAAGPKPLKTWFYGSELTGLEFVYPVARAKEIAKTTGRHVMASNSKDAAIVAVTPNGKQIVIDGEPAQTARRKPQ